MLYVPLALFLLQIPGAPPPEVRITHGPILGHVTSREISIWARTNRPGQFRIIYGTSPNRLDQVSNPATTSLDHDNTGWAKLTGLQPGAKYYYQPITSRDVGPKGSFHTVPDSADFQDPATNPTGLFNFRFHFGSCSNQLPGNTPGLPAYGTLNTQWKDKLLLSILDGDWLYEEKRDYSVEQWRGQVGIRPEQTPRILQIAPSLTGVWENYKSFLDRGANLAEFHRNVPSYYTADDHEILNDVYGTGSVGRRDRRTLFRDIGLQAWQDYLTGSQPAAYSQPTTFGEARLEAGSDILTDPAADFTKLDLGQVTNLHVHWGGQNAGVDNNRADSVGPGDPNAGVYGIVQVLDRNRLRIRPAAKQTKASPYSLGRSHFALFRVGNVQFYLLDTRAERDMHDTANPNASGTSMLGKRQREWLKKHMAASDADFFFLASTVNVTIPHVAGPATDIIAGKDDAWTAFLEEREEMIKFWDGLGKPVMVMTGDLHNSWAIKITDRVWEFASGPMNSQNHGARSEGGRPPNGLFDSRGRPVDIRWSSYIKDDTPPAMRNFPIFAVAQINNVFSNPNFPGKPRWIAYPRPHVVIQYYDGRTGDLLYAESVQGKAR